MNKLNLFAYVATQQHLRPHTGQQSGAVVCTDASQHDGPGFDPQGRVLLHGVCMFSPGTLTSSHMQNGW